MCSLKLRVFTKSNHVLRSPLEVKLTTPILHSIKSIARKSENSIQSRDNELNVIRSRIGCYQQGERIVSLGGVCRPATIFPKLMRESRTKDQELRRSSQDHTIAATSSLSFWAEWCRWCSWFDAMTKTFKRFRQIFLIIAHSRTLSEDEKDGVKSKLYTSKEIDLSPMLKMWLQQTIQEQRILTYKNRVWKRVNPVKNNKLDRWKFYSTWLM